MEAIQLVQLSPAELRAMMAEAVAEGVQAGIVRAKETLASEQPVSKAEFMRLANYKDDALFRAFCKNNGIQPYEKRARRNYFLPSQINGIQRTKGIHLK